MQHLRPCSITVPHLQRDTPLTPQPPSPNWMILAKLVATYLGFSPSTGDQARGKVPRELHRPLSPWGTGRLKLRGGSFPEGTTPKTQQSPADRTHPKPIFLSFFARGSCEVVCGWPHMSPVREPGVNVLTGEPLIEIIQRGYVLATTDL